VARDIIRRINLPALAESTGAQFHPSVEAFLLDLYARQGRFGARMIKQYIDMKLNSDIRRLPAPHGVIYKDATGVTQQVHDGNQIQSFYQRQHVQQQNPVRQRVHVDTSTDRAFRDSVSPAIAAVLTFDAAGGYRGSSTGFFVTNTGYLMTNRHVVGGCTRLVALHNAGQVRTDMIIVGVSDYFDLAVLKPAQPLDGGVAFLTLANSGSVEVDTEVQTFGYPYLEYDPVTEGVNFATPERSQRGHVGVRLEDEQLFRLSGVGLNPGNSGGPLFRCDDGSVVGVIFAKREASEGMSYAIMSGVAQAFLREMGIVQPFTRIDRAGL
jgi:S1-C subfamily serine protease